MSRNEPQSVELSAGVLGLDDILQSKLDHATQLCAEAALTNDANMLYQKCFQILKLGGLEAEIPRLVVFGQQSMGKTTLLDMVMGGPIGFSSTDTGTKQPVVIMLKPAKNATKGRGDDNIDCSLNGRNLRIKDLEKAMHNIMASADGISSQELELEIAVPNGVHAVFVDLPGLKDDTPEGARVTRDVVRTYVAQNPNDLYILVKKASDDPANWSFELSDFILSAKPIGLGLTPKQTMVVGTRSRDFLLGEKNDIKTQKELWDRVQKRAVRDSHGHPLPLYLLELFSLSLEEKESCDFTTKRELMKRQIMKGKDQCLAILSTSFQKVDPLTESKLKRIFDYQAFRQDLNSNFQRLLSDQLGVLEGRLHRQKLNLAGTVTQLERDLADQGTQSFRESIKSFVRELMQIVTEMITGNFMLLKHPDGGDAFLERYGGNLEDNLQDGDDLARQLFTNPRYYQNGFYGKLQEEAERAVKRVEARREADAQAAANLLQQVTGSPATSSATSFKADMPCPDRSGEFKAGQFVRMTLTKDESQLLGFVHRELAPGIDMTKVTDVNAVDALVTFQCVAPATERRATPVETAQTKPSLRHRLRVVRPLAYEVTSAITVPPGGMLVWHKILRSDSWVGLEAVKVTSITNIEPVANPWMPDAVHNAHRPISATVHDGVATYVTVKLGDSKRSLASLNIMAVPTGGAPHSPEPFSVIDGAYKTASVLEFFADVDEYNGFATQSPVLYNTLSSLQKIAGPFADKKLLNQLSLTCLARWLRFHIKNLQPECRFSEHVMLQLQRAVKHVVDKADTEPLIADLLQSNVESTLLPLTKLAACASAVALRRILRAGLAEICRQIKTGEISQSLDFLVASESFLAQVEAYIDDFCKQKAIKCSEEMRHLVFDQTHAIHFEQITDVFDDCRQFETEFLGTNTLCDMTQKISEGLQNRKQRLSRSDIYAMGPVGVNYDAIYEEVRVHFWVAKMLMSAPMTSKLYLEFVTDIKDKTPHLAAERKAQISAESILERKLLSDLLSNGSESTSVARSEDELRLHFGLVVNIGKMQAQLAASKRAIEYITSTFRVITKLRSTLNKDGGVDFLSRLEFSGSPEGSVTTTRESIRSPPLTTSCTTSEAEQPKVGVPSQLFSNPVAPIVRNFDRPPPKTEGQIHTLPAPSARTSAVKEEPTSGWDTAPDIGVKPLKSIGAKQTAAPYTKKW